jgi:putative hydrolase of the HAD superfamily
MNNIKAVIFDIDETLVNRKAAFLSLCNYFIDKYSTVYPYEVNKEDLINYMIEIDANGYGGLENFITRLNKVWKLPLTVQEFIDERNTMFGRFTVPFHEAFEVLEYMKARYRLGVITNGYSAVQREKIRVAGLEGYFDDIIVSDETGTAKPDPSIFRLSCANTSET